jgi:hypothetical protein
MLKKSNNLIAFLLSCFILIGTIDGKAEDVENSSTQTGDYADLYRQTHPDVYKDSCWYGAEPETDCEYARAHCLSGVWLPEGPPLFRPFIADPRQVTYSAGWRFHDRVITKNVIDVSFGDSLPIYRWCKIWWGGDLQIELEGALWAVFDPLHESSPLVNADYYVGIPICYSQGNWSFRLRGYHISSHIGDEFLLNHPHFDRKNPSTEFLDFAVSYQWTKEIRLYGLLGWRARQDESFCCSRWYSEAGFEWRFPRWGYRDYCNRLYGEPFIGVHLRYQPDFDQRIDATYVAGFEWGKFSGLRRKLRIFLEYHNGYSVEGQFCKIRTDYVGIRGSYGF